MIKDSEVFNLKSKRQRISRRKLSTFPAQTVKKAWAAMRDPLQCSCLEKPRDRGAWWDAVYGVAQSRTRLSDLAAAAAIREGLVDMWKDFQRWLSRLAEGAWRNRILRGLQKQDQWPSLGLLEPGWKHAFLEELWLAWLSSSSRNYAKCFILFS